MSTYNSFVATYAHHDLAELDIEKMQNAGFDMDKLRVVARKPYHIAEQRRLAPVLNSFSALGTAFCGCIPEEDIASYEAEVEAGRIFILAYGSAEEINKIKCIADSTHQTNWDGIADSAVYYGCTD